jgi:hypothetical protein
MNLTELARPWTAADAEIPSEWAQRAFYRRPVIAERIDELVARVSLFTTDDAAAFRLWDPQHEQPAWPDYCFPCTAALSPVSLTPIETGYLELMRLVAARDGVAAGEAITAFARLQLDRYRDMERYLVDVYGALSPEREHDPRFRGIDYPAFDLGPVKLGLGLFATGGSIWCWSRVVNWHK